MLARLSLLTVFVLTLAVMAGVFLFYYGEWAEIDRRDKVLTELDRVAEEDGPCAALEYLRQVDGPRSYNLERAIDARKPDYAREILASRDRKSIAVLLGADDEGTVDRTLCEEIRLTQSLGERHPVVALLRFTRENVDPCEEADEIAAVLRGLSSHRPNLLRALMADPARMSCFEPDIAQRVASFTVDWLQEDPSGLDDGDHLEAAAFLNDHAPVRAAQFGCTLEATRASSKVGAAIGCSSDMRERVLLRYRYVGPETDSVSGDVLMLGRRGNRCQVRPVDTVKVLSVNCDLVELVTDVRIAVRVENIAYGLVRADMIAGVADYDGRAKRVSKAGVEPALGSWFAYDLDGAPLGTTQVVSLEELADRLKEDIPSSPIRDFCRSLGAKYCYDVDWTKTVKAIDGEPSIYLSRPLSIFLEPMNLPLDAEALMIREVFGREPDGASIYRLFRLGETGTLALEGSASAVEIRWRRSESSPWQRESLGAGEAGSNGRLPPSARLLAAMDLEQDGTPELLVQRVFRVMESGKVRDSSDEIVLMVLAQESSQFQVLNRLTVHEF
ncbi:MAG: hypothetical protein AAF654_01420 [Myxococcota bacterium]